MSVKSESNKSKPNLNASSQIELVSMSKLRIDNQIYPSSSKNEKENFVYVYFNFGEIELGYTYDKECPWDFSLYAYNYNEFVKNGKTIYTWRLTANRRFRLTKIGEKRIDGDFFARLYSCGHVSLKIKGKYSYNNDYCVECGDWFCQQCGCYFCGKKSLMRKVQLIKWEQKKE
ncbi:MAG: hypothetical protein I3270_01065 [Candidatus Moeniiplasma glomeromycotorum]|nr:hypothetical protein [Candidatus Moeniiplasma glomeromycotorum]MCE8162301.1 hypothetical protein [Candidatus Moeniiplasma glomeromycotorum]MCE8166225.1 hypothetical protein [Candidatus Moeniiplasma glomeromycotorum]MCE8166707.1 hypothetical protein [Candidatus Moeniiplasma glomeromycotorum]